MQIEIPLAADQAVQKPRAWARIRALLPGLLVSLAVALLAMLVHELPGFSLVSPMIVAVVAGMALNAFGLVPRRAAPGIGFATRPVLRFAIILLGFQLTLTQMREVGLTGTAVIALSLVSSFLAIQWIGRWLGVDRKLTQLIAAGTSICGASAIVAVNSVTRADDEDVAYALACVTLCGTLAMFCFPLAMHVAALDGYHYGLWAGAGIHEVGQVVGAAFQGGQAAGEFGTIAKLTRVVMLVPLIMVLGLAARRASPALSTASRQPPVPLFILLFLGVVCLNSAVTVPPDAKAAIVASTTLLLTVALGAIGLAANVRKLRDRGLKPLLLGVAGSVFIALTSLALIKLAT